MDYQTWKASVLGKVLNIDGSDPGQCTQVALSWAQSIYPGIVWDALVPAVPEAREMFTNVATHYFTAIPNDHNDPNQLPLQGDIMVFDATPQAGYEDSYGNPDGHTGVCDGATSSGYSLVQQNAPYFGSPVNVTSYPWHFRPCLGWLRPVASAPQPEYYTVVSGDTVSGICEEFGISEENNYESFRALNPQIADINLIYPGDHVRVK